MPNIYITQLLNKIIESIEGILLLLILLNKMNELFSNTFKLSLQRMNIWKIKSLSIFHVLI